MKIQVLLTRLATLGPVGYCPASGTVASFLTLIPVIALWYFWIHPWDYALILALLMIIAYNVIAQALYEFHDEDPSEIVIDELVGCLVTFWAIPLNAYSLVIGFVIFRLFDICKPFGIERIEQRGGAWGVLMDDVAAGLLTNIFLHGMTVYYGW
jgi:phosphatidylglycerophosphatase A